MINFHRNMLILGVATLLLSPLGVSQESLTVTRTAWVKAAGNDIYDSGNLSNPLQIQRWRGRELTATIPLRSAANEKTQLLATYGTVSGDLFVCYSKAFLSGALLAVLGRLDFDNNSIHQKWADEELYPRSIAVGPTGYLYLLGLTRNEEKRLFLDLKGDEALEVNLLHIINRNGSKASTTPISISAPNQDAALSLVRRSSLSFKRNGNFFLVFDPFTVRNREWESLVSKDAIEYNPDGKPVELHTFPFAPAGSVIGSLVVDVDDSLILQFVDFSVSQAHQQAIRTFKWNGSYVFRVPSAGGPPEPILPDLLPRHELVMGILADGRILTQVFAKNIVRIWTR